MNTWKKHKPVLLPAHNNTTSIRQSISGELSYCDSRFVGIMGGGKHLYILSDEQLREGNIVYECDHNGRPLNIDTCTEDHLIRIKHGIDTECYKIIASTDKSIGLPGIPESFLKHFCERDGMDEVMVGWFYMNDISLDGVYTPRRALNTSSENEIFIMPVKETWTRDEVKSLFNKFYATAFIDQGVTGEMFNAWLKDNL